MSDLNELKSMDNVTEYDLNELKLIAKALVNANKMSVRIKDIRLRIIVRNNGRTTLAVSWVDITTNGLLNKVREAAIAL